MSEKKRDNIITPELFVGQEKKTFDGASHVDKVEEAKKEGSIVKVLVLMVDKENAYVEYAGVRGIIPLKELDTKLENKNAIGFVGRPINIIILGYDPEAKVFAASRVKALEKAKEVAINNYKVGDKVSGTVISVFDWGALMDIGGIKGRLAVADMAHRYIPNPKEFVKEGEYFDVLITKIGTNEKGEERVSLSLKALIEEPWKNVDKEFKVGAVVLGKVTGFLNKDQGVFVELKPDVEALGDLPGFEVKVGQYVRARIGKINMEKKRIRVQLVSARHNPSGE